MLTIFDNCVLISAYDKSEYLTILKKTLFNKTSEPLDRYEEEHVSFFSENTILLYDKLNQFIEQLDKFLRKRMSLSVRDSESLSLSVRDSESLPSSIRDSESLPKRNTVVNRIKNLFKGKVSHSFSTENSTEKALSDMGFIEKNVGGKTRRKRTKKRKNRGRKSRRIK
jgi:hypothetical protein